MTLRAGQHQSWLEPIDWGKIAPLRLRARTVAEGVYAGSHRSRRRGPGVEFGGHRPYTPGDDLRWIDRHSLMRHDRLMIRQFETETERGVHLLVDATSSMSFSGAKAPGPKLAYAALLAAALAHVALSTRDPVSLDWLGGRGVRAVAPTSGGEAFDRIVSALSAVQAVGDTRQDVDAFERSLSPIARRARRGSVVVFLSDLLDLPRNSEAKFAALAAGGRKLIVVQVLDDEELTLPYHGSVRLQTLEGKVVVEADMEIVRDRYLGVLDKLTRSWADPLAGRGGQVIRTSTSADPVEVVRSVVRAVSEGVS